MPVNPAIDIFARTKSKAFSMEHSIRVGRRTETQINALLKKQEEGKLTVQQFCKIYKIHRATFYNWRNKYRQQVEKHEEFIPARFNDVDGDASLFAEIELSSIKVKLFHKVDSSYIKALLLP